MFSVFPSIRPGSSNPGIVRLEMDGWSRRKEEEREGIEGRKASLTGATINRCIACDFGFWRQPDRHRHCSCCFCFTRSTFCISSFWHFVWVCLVKKREGELWYIIALSFSKILLLYYIVSLNHVSGFVGEAENIRMRNFITACFSFYHSADARLWMNSAFEKFQGCLLSCCPFYKNFTTDWWLFSLFFFFFYHSFCTRLIEEKNENFSTHVGLPREKVLSQCLICLSGARTIDLPVSGKWERDFKDPQWNIRGRRCESFGSNLHRPI